VPIVIPELILQCRVTEGSRLIPFLNISIGDVIDDVVDGVDLGGIGCVLDGIVDVVEMC
jgi:hypothetical protein